MLDILKISDDVLILNLQEEFSFKMNVTKQINNGSTN